MISKKSTNQLKEFVENLSPIEEEIERVLSEILKLEEQLDKEYKETKELNSKIDNKLHNRIRVLEEIEKTQKTTKLIVSKNIDLEFLWDHNSKKFIISSAEIGDNIIINQKKILN